MKLQGILHKIQSLKEFRRIREGVEQNTACPVSILTAARPAFISALIDELKRPILLVTASTEAAAKRLEQLRAWCPEDVSVLAFPEPDGLPFERMSPDPATTHDRLRTLFKLATYNRGKDKTPIVVASAAAVLSRTQPYGPFKEAIFHIHRGMKVSPLSLVERFHRLGYLLDPDTELPGNMSRRGGIIDIFPSYMENPVRIDFLGDEIESLRIFNPLTQRSIEEIKDLWISPASEVARLATTVSLSAILESLNLMSCSEEVKGVFTEELSLLIEGTYRPGLEFYSPVFNTGNIMDFLPPGSLLLLEEPQLIFHSQEKLEEESRSLKEARVTQGELPSNFPSIFIPVEEMKEKINRFASSLAILSLPAEGTLSLPFTPAPSLARVFSLAPGRNETGSPAPAGLELSHDPGKSIIFISAQAKRIQELLEERNILVSPGEELLETPWPGNIYLISGFVEEGWSLGAEDSGVTLVLTDREIFGTLKQRRLIKRHRSGLKLFLPSLQPGDYVVHVDHGVARFNRVIRKKISGIEREYLELEYASEDKLYVPVNQIDRVNRYVGASADPPNLTRLGTREWHRTKGRAREAALEIAAELLHIYAGRELACGFAFSPDKPWQMELEDSFIYEETPDQLKATLEVKLDMEKQRPMDRLICGDVGYGKTEVAVRAAFKAVLDGKQVAFLVPTTILTQQHFSTFQERLKAFPVRVEALSRFRSPKEQHLILGGLKDGVVDICLGTHRLLQKDVSFKDLGLVIIDEEQRFGVMHKEQLKKLRSEVDVLTLSATPIPRTLHLALAGLRDTSIMETPPEERLPIKTFVSEFSERLIREAVLRELERGGQIFFLHNRVKTIPGMSHRLSTLIPEAKIVVAHGQMPEEELEEAMLRFTSGEGDILICSTIIESGLDLPRANTLLVNDADKLGLTQLYHLRGRIGRGNTQAYAYFLYQPAKLLSSNAHKRLQTIYEATELGSGFRIAMADLEIRGAGNILGKEQSGQIDAVGFELYTQILSEAVMDLRAASREKMPEIDKKVIGQQRGHTDVAIDLPVPFYVPVEYIREEKTRLELYMRMSRITTMEALMEIKEETGDRFGKMPQPVENLIRGIKLKLLAEEAKVTSISLEGQNVVIRSARDLRYLTGAESLNRRLGDKVEYGKHQISLNISRMGDTWLRMLEEIMILIR